MPDLLKLFGHRSDANLCRCKARGVLYAVSLFLSLSLIVSVEAELAIVQTVSLNPEIASDMEPIAVWKMLSESPLVLNSNVHEDGFSMDMFALQADNSELRVILDQRVGQILEAGMSGGDADRKSVV